MAIHRSVCLWIQSKSKKSCPEAKKILSPSNWKNFPVPSPDYSHRVSVWLAYVYSYRLKLPFLNTFQSGCLAWLQKWAIVQGMSSMRMFAVYPTCLQCAHCSLLFWDFFVLGCFVAKLGKELDVPCGDRSKQEISELAWGRSQRLK